jgi:hypothetical protein
VLPVSEAGCSGSHGAGQTDCNRRIGSGAKRVIFSGNIDGVEQDCHRPGAERHIGDDRVERVAQPGTV